MSKLIIEEENNINRWFLRRSEEFVEVLKTLCSEEDPCQFGDEFEYASNIINWVMESSFDYDEYESFEDELIDYLKEKFGEYLFDRYYDADC